LEIFINLIKSIPLFSITSVPVGVDLSFCGAVIWFRDRTWREWRTICIYSLCTLCLPSRFKPSSQFFLHINFNLRSILFMGWRNKIWNVPWPSSQAHCSNRFLVLSWILPLTNTIKFTCPRMLRASDDKMDEWMLLTRQATIKAWLAPPRESCKIRVNLLSRYGTRGSLLFSARITLDNANNDWLILELSSRRIPSLQVLLLSSLPD